jgi:hypothetical protein
MKSHPSTVQFGNIGTLVLVGIAEITLIAAFLYTLFGT